MSLSNLLFYFGSSTKLKKKSELAKEICDNSQTAEQNCEQNPIKTKQ